MIRAKVAKVLSNDELVINKGEVDGVEVGMIFEVSDERLDEIIDPDTGESLGSIDMPRALIGIVRTGRRAAFGRRFEGAMLFGIGANSYRSARPRGILGQPEYEGEIQVGDLAVWDGKRTSRTL